MFCENMQIRRHDARRRRPTLENLQRELRRTFDTVSYTHLRAHETVLDLVCRLLLEKKKQKTLTNNTALTRHYYDKDQYYVHNIILH